MWRQRHAAARRAHVSTKTQAMEDNLARTRWRAAVTVGAAAAARLLLAANTLKLIILYFIHEHNKQILENIMYKHRIQVLGSSGCLRPPRARSRAEASEHQQQWRWRWYMVLMCDVSVFSTRSSAPIVG